MVVTRSTRPQTRLRRTSGSSQEKSSAPDGIQTQSESRNESESDDGSITASQTCGTHSSVPKTTKRKSRASSLAEIPELSADGETSEAESNCSSVCEVQEPVLRITRRRQIVIPPTPQNSVRKRQKMTPIHESLDEEVVSEAESHTSGISRVESTTEIRSRRKMTKCQTVPSQETHAESDAESSCSGISSSGVLPRRTPRNRQRKLQVEVKQEGTQIVQGNEKQTRDTSVNSEDSNTRQTFPLPLKSLSPINKPNFCNIETYNDPDGSLHRNSEKLLTVQSHNLDKREENQADGASSTEIKNCKNLNKEDIKIIHEEKVINKKSSPLDSPELWDTSFEQSVSQEDSTSPNNKTTSPSVNCENIMKSLAQTFAVVKVDRWTREKKGSMKISDLTHLSDDSGSDEQPTSIDDCEDKKSPKLVDLKCDTSLFKSELSTSQEVEGSVLLVLSSDESQQSENSESEEDALSVTDSSGQKKSVSGDSHHSPCDSALFVIDRTPGLNADKNFYLEDKASEAAIEEKEEEEEGEDDHENSGEESSDSDKNKDECSDEEDFLSNTKSKLLKLTSSSIDPGLSIKQLGGLYINFSADKLQPKKILTQIKEKKKNELLHKAVITPDFEKKDCVPPYSESKHQLQKKRRQERQKTAGNGWFGMKAPELTEELKNDLRALKMRASMDPKRFYKKNDRDGFPKYFQVGTIVDNPADFYHSRVPKKQRKKTIVEELLADSEFRRFNRRKYSEIMAEKAANAAGKKFRKKKKFRN